MKYKLIKDKTGFFRIKALKDIPIHNVKKGDIGGLNMPFIAEMGRIG